MGLMTVKDVYGSTALPSNLGKSDTSSYTNSASGGVAKEMSDNPNAPIKSILLIFGLLFAIRFVWEIT